MTGLRAAIGFLTRVPVADGRPLSGSALTWFPAVGAVIGLVIGVVYAVGYQILPSPLAAVVAVASGVLMTGALHEDGLADTLDAIGSGQTGERALEIMRDSNLGTYGVLAVVFSVLWRVLAIASLGPVEAVAGLAMVHILSRTAVVGLMATSKSVRPEGLGRIGVESSRGAAAPIALITGLAIAGVSGGWWLVPSAAMAMASVLWVRRASASRFSGVTGDVLGACEQLTEMSVLVVVAGLTWSGFDVWWS